MITGGFPNGEVCGKQLNQTYSYAILAKDGILFPTDNSKRVDLKSFRTQVDF